MATVVLVRYISIWKLFTVDSAALLHNFLLFVEISDKHDLFLEMSDLSCTPTVPPPRNGAALTASDQSDHTVNKR